ncbi:MAG TPA: hypothetical protein VFH73_15410 [Polyangia bacterium]|nr:hypothetical protein [Polyangia bacterium]
MLAAAVGLLAGCSSSTPPGGASGAGGKAGSGGQQSGGAGGNASGTGGSSGSGGSAGSGGGTGGSAGTGGTTPDSGAMDTRVDLGGGDGDAAGMGGLVLPIVRGDSHVLEFGPLVFEVKGAIGARITSLKLEGDELLTGPVANPRFYGSTLWTSPADDWVVGMFDPPSIVDRDPYMMTVSADGAITATNAPFTVKGKRFTVTKVFRADVANQAIIIDYKLTNNGTTAPFSLSHWEVTRVFPDGLTFFPTGTASKIDFLPQPVQLKTAMGYTWWDNKTHLPMKGESKAGVEATGGFIAHVAPKPNGDILFIKSFKDVPAAMAPPGHYEIELFCNDAHSYVELEDHSAYIPIAVGQTYTQTVKWYVRRLPAGDHTLGSATLIAAAKGVLGL